MSNVNAVRLAVSPNATIDGVGKNSPTVLSRFWTKVYQIWAACTGDPVNWHVSFRLWISCSVVQILSVISRSRSQKSVFCPQASARFSYFFVSVPSARSSASFRQLWSARKSTVSYRCYLSSLLSSPLTTLQYAMYFRFCGCLRSPADLSPLAAANALVFWGTVEALCIVRKQDGRVHSPPRVVTSRLVGANISLSTFR